MADGNNGLNMKTVIIIVVLIVIIAAGTSFGVMKYLLNVTSEDKETQQKNEEIGPTYKLGDFTVNITGTGGYSFIKASIVVEVSKKDVVEELEKRSPQIRDTIITILRNKKLEDIEDPGTELIKKQIRSRVNNYLADGKIEHVWFTQLVVQ